MLEFLSTKDMMASILFKTTTKQDERPTTKEWSHIHSEFCSKWTKNISIMIDSSRVVGGFLFPLPREVPDANEVEVPHAIEK